MEGFSSTSWRPLTDSVVVKPKRPPAPAPPEEILSEENVNKCVNRAKEAATTISESDTYKKAKESIKKVTETEEFKDGMIDLKDFGAKSLSLTSKGLDKLSKKLTDTKK